MHKVKSNRSPNTIRRAAFALCYYLGYLSEKQMEIPEVCQLAYDEPNEHFVRFLYWFKIANAVGIKCVLRAKA